MLSTKPSSRPAAPKSLARTQATVHTKEGRRSVPRKVNRALHQTVWTVRRACLIRPNETQDQRPHPRAPVGDASWTNGLQESYASERGAVRWIAWLGHGLTFVPTLATT